MAVFNHIKKPIISLFIFLTSFTCLSQTIQKEIFNGIVLDSQTNEPMAYVYIYLPDYEDGTITDLKGAFTIRVKNFVPSKNKALASCVGYKSKIIFLTKNAKSIVIKMDQEVQVLQEVVVKKQKYQNKNNPAVDLIEKVIANKKQNSNEALDYYENEKYEKVQLLSTTLLRIIRRKKYSDTFSLCLKTLTQSKTMGKRYCLYI